MAEIQSWQVKSRKQGTNFGILTHLLTHPSRTQPRTQSNIQPNTHDQNKCCPTVHRDNQSNWQQKKRKTWLISTRRWGNNETHKENYQRVGKEEWEEVIIDINTSKSKAPMQMWYLLFEACLLWFQSGKVWNVLFSSRFKQSSEVKLMSGPRLRVFEYPFPDIFSVPATLKNGI